MKPNFINFPENSSEVVDEDTDHVYNCTVASSNRTKVQWLSSRGPVPECINDNSLAPSCNNCFTENRPCVTSSVTVAEELFLVHSLILHLYNVSANHSDQYTCKVQGIDEELVRRNNLMIQQSIVVFVNVMETDANVAIDDGNKILIPLVSASVSTLILIMLVFTIIVMVKLFCYFKNPCGSHATEDGNQEIELTPTSPTKKAVKEGDEWEFPREKLKLLQKIGKIAIANHMDACYWYTYIQVLEILVKC